MSRLQVLKFPNPSRSFDASKSRVRFWGYDSAIEVSFFVEESALRLLCPQMSDAEAGFLSTFDAARVRIHKVAEKVYVRSGRGASAYGLAAKDF
jgi:Protein of unknown function (DUF1488)